MLLPEYRQAIERSHALASALCQLRCGNASAPALSSHILATYGPVAQASFDTMAESVTPLPASQPPQPSAEGFPVGSIFLTTAQGSPASMLGYGTWEAFGAGRMLVGLDVSQVEFDAIGKTGGAKTHTLAVGEIPAHTHVQNAHTHAQDSHTHVQDPHTHVQNSHNHVQDAHSHTIPVGATDDTAAPFDRADAGANTAGANATTATGTATATNQAATAVNQSATATNQSATAVNQSATAVNQNTGGGGAHNNLPPYVVVFMWRRTA